MNYAIILAGGIGSRFWPLSRELEPKQFLNICSDKPMIEEAISRISRRIPKENIYIAANKIHGRRLKRCLEGLRIPPKKILLEPERKNTFAPIICISSLISSLDSNAVCVVLPCDHFIKHNGRFIKALRRAIDIAAKGHIVTFGFRPKRPETGYGYIKIKANAKGRNAMNGYPIERFLEKPSLKKAKRFIKDKRYYWNSGIFVFRPDIMLEEAKKFMPAAYKIIMKLKQKNNFAALWHKLPNVSVDYAIMEKTRNAVLVFADYGWVDLGSWQAIEETAKKDKDGNFFRGNCISIGNKNTLVWSDKRLVAALGLGNIIIVDTKDALLVCSKNKTQDVKRVVQVLRQREMEKRC